jgi:hypothetical protein
VTACAAHCMLPCAQVQADGTVRVAYKNTIECIKHLHAAHGIKGFYRGSLANTYRATGAALCMALYDTFQDMLKQ